MPVKDQNKIQNKTHHTTAEAGQIELFLSSK